MIHLLDFTHFDNNLLKNMTRVTINISVQSIYKLRNNCSKFIKLPENKSKLFGANFAILLFKKSMQSQFSWYFGAKTGKIQSKFQKWPFLMKKSLIFCKITEVLANLSSVLAEFWPNLSIWVSEFLQNSRGFSCQFLAQFRQKLCWVLKNYVNKSLESHGT